MTKITNKLLKEAIADAEAVRETAVANAKLVLEEAITPQIKDMVARRLRLEAESSEDEIDSDVESGEPENADPIGGSDFPADDSVIGADDNKEPSDESSDTSDIGGDGAPEGSDDNWYNDWDEADFELDSIIKELEEDIAALTGKDKDAADDEVPTSDTPSDDVPVDSSDDEPSAPVAPEAPVAKDASDDDKVADETSTTDVDKFAKAPAAVKPDGGDDEEELDLDEFLAELEAEDEEEKKSVFSDKDAMASKLAGLKNDLAQYKEAVAVMRERLSEVNLLNAKLLFTNKMFRKDTLTQEQKISIVESFDRATTVREVKLVYTALVENLATAARTFTKPVAARKNIVAEGLASKPTPSTAPKTKPIVESTIATRWQQLAGIIEDI